MESEYVMNKERHLFPGSNTSMGFHSFFQYIIPLNEAKRIFYIKGGPGTGKSFLMKKIGKIFSEKGYSIEYFHCSSDNESLDGVVIKELGIALLDGTAPHINDPKVPGALDEIINFGVCLNESNLSKVKEEITNVDNKIKDSFKRAYAYLGAAKKIHDDWRHHNSKALDKDKLRKLKIDFKNKVIKNNVDKIGSERHLFATAFTPNGIITYIDTIYKHCSKTYLLKGGPGTGKTELLNYIKEEALVNGYDVEVFHDPLNPERIEHLILPELDTALLTSSEISKLSLSGEAIDMDSLLNNDYVDSVKDLILEDSYNFYKLLDVGLKNLSNCKRLHDDLEKYYVDNIDFQCRDEISEKLIHRLLEY